MRPVLAILLSTIGCAATLEPSMPTSDHFDGTRFFVPGAPAQPGPSSLFRWMAPRTRGHWRPYEDFPPGPKPPERVLDMRVTFINHATTLIQMDGLNLLTDPIWSKRCSPVAFAGPARKRPPGIRFEDLPAIDAIFISHNHYDHMDLPTLERLRDSRGQPRVFVGLGNKAFLESQGIPNVTELDWWESRELAPGVRVTAVPVQHFSNRGVADRNHTLWTGFVFSGPSGNAFFAGDTGFGPHFKAIGEAFGRLRLAVLPIGAYKPEWFMSPVHESPAEAVQAQRELGAETAVAMHFGTFALADDGQDEPVDALNIELQNHPDQRFWVLGFGEGRDVPPLATGNAP
jgi:L-ascorbate metabolism protein UlaG (beta-lactamase superfamily)